MFNFKTKKLLVISLIQCRFDFTFFLVPWVVTISTREVSDYSVPKKKNFKVFHHGGHLNHATLTV